MTFANNSPFLGHSIPSAPLLAITIIAVFLQLPCPSHSSGDRDLRYSVGEELQPGTFIGNVSLDAGLNSRHPPAMFRSLTYMFLGKPQHVELFFLEENSGVLRTADVIDRDVICPGQSECVVELQVAIYPPLYFEVVKVKVTFLEFLL